MSEKSKEYFQNNKEKSRTKVRKNRHKRAEWFKEFKKTLKCTKCEENHPSCIDFHHKDDKKENVSRLVKQAYAEARIIIEIEKCEVLCANCHRILHDSMPKKYIKSAKRLWFREIKSKAICIQCGCDNPACIDFHHRQGKINKDYAVSKLVFSASRETILNEIKKCDPLCSNCHRKHHYKDGINSPDL